MADGLSRGLAYGLYLLAALLLGALLVWAYRMVAVGGSVSNAWQMAISLGWSALAFVMITAIGGALCLFTATSVLNAGHGKD
jgi:low affinity Fe/Cu permease